MKRIVFFIFLLIAGIAIVIGLIIKKSETTQPSNNNSGIKNPRVGCTLEAIVCPDGSSVGRQGPNCEFAKCPGEENGIQITFPQPNTEITSPLKIEGRAKGNWFFEAQFSAELLDGNGKKLGIAILRAKSDWMTDDFVPFDGELKFVEPTTDKGTLRFFSDNPSGLPENQRVYDVTLYFSFDDNSDPNAQKRNILLYYYNSGLDKDDSGNIMCSDKGLVAIERTIPISSTPIKDTVNVLLEGKENLSNEDIAKGITTEYPLQGFKLTEANLKSDGVLTLKFEDSQNKTSGGSCRVGILWKQLEKTAMQFPNVKRVQFLPEELFQP